ncbi:MAG TPA: TonB-dependent receptor, partial [Hyphomonadaceae bacterium]
MRNWKKMTVAAASVLALAQTAHAQERGAVAQVPAAQPADQGRQAFEPAFFARFSPVTALDMVRQLPGFTIDEGEELRGFGATAGNVLIGGQRPTTKTSLSDELGRIAARDVLRIELIRASAAGEIDVRGYTELANVVLKPATKMQVSTTWSATTRWLEQGRQSFLIGGTRAWKTDNFGFRLNVQGTSFGEREEVESNSFSPAGAPTSRQTEFYQQQLGELLVTGAGNWT